MNRPFVRFLFVGAANTVFFYAVYLLLLPVMPYAIAYAIGYAGGIILSYVLNSLFVFHERMSLKKGMQFPLVYLVQYLLGTLILVICIDLLGMDARLGPVVTVIGTVPATFLLSKWIIKGQQPINGHA